jgi:predicted dehydrogenase
MLNSEKLDLVYVTTPTSLHLPIIAECVDQGISFFVEKPLGTSSSECIPFINKIKQNPVTNMVGYSKHYVDTFVKAKEVLDSNVLGDSIHLSSYMRVSQMFAKGKGWRFKKETSGGGVLNILATHLVDLLIWLFGDIKYVNGNISSYYSKDVEDFVHSYLVFDNGLEGYLDASWSVRGYRLPEICIEVDAKDGKLVVTEDSLKIYSDKTSRWVTYYKQDLYKGVEIDIGGPEYTREDKHMLESVINKSDTQITVFHAFKVQSVTDAIYLSAMNKSSIEVDYHEC